MTASGPHWHLVVLPESSRLFQVAQKTSLQPFQVQDRAGSLSQSGYTVMRQKESIWELLSVIPLQKGRGRAPAEVGPSQVQVVKRG